MIDTGSPFPDFSLHDQSGEVVTLASLKGSKAVIYFYPKDDTPGCTKQACNFRDSLAAFEGVRVLGVSPDSAKSHTKFADKFHLNFPLLADTEHTLAESVGVWVEKSMYGKKYMGIERSTFLLDENGVVLKAWRKVSPESNTEEVLAALR